MNKKSSNLLFFLFILFAIALVVFNGNIGDKIVELREKNLPESFCDSGPVSQFYYNSLTQNQKRAYICIYNGIKNHTEKIQIPKISDGELSVIFEGVQFDNPDIFCVGDKGYIIKSAGAFYFQPQYLMDKDKCDSCNKQLEEVALDILNFTSSMSAFEKELYIHDYIAENCTYTETEFDNTAYGCLVNNNAVCSGYSLGFMYLLDKAGVRCDVVSGDAIDGDGKKSAHMWNIVNISDKYYIVDVTWDDIETDKSSDIIHLYFNLDYSSACINHKSEKNIKDLPFGKEFYYFNMNRTNFSFYTGSDFESLIDLSVQNVNNGVESIEFVFSDKDVYEYACEKLFSEDSNGDLSKLIYHINLKANKRVNFNYVTYIQNDNFNYIRITFLENNR